MIRRPVWRLHRRFQVFGGLCGSDVPLDQPQRADEPWVARYIGDALAELMIVVVFVAHSPPPLIPAIRASKSLIARATLFPMRRLGTRFIISRLIYTQLLSLSSLFSTRLIPRPRDGLPYRKKGEGILTYLALDTFPREEETTWTH